MAFHKKQLVNIIFGSLFFLLITATGCQSHQLRGVYVCDQSQKKGDSTVQKENGSEHFFDLTCVLESLTFKGNSTVELQLKNGPLIVSYVIDKNLIRINGNGSDLLFNIKDKNTLAGEGIVAGLYRKQ